MVSSIYISLTKWNHLTSPEFIGAANFVRLFLDPVVYREFFNTLFFMLIMVPLIIVLSLFLANALNKKTPFTGFFRTVFFLPYVLLPVVSALVWLIMFNSRYGLINTLLGRLSLPQPSWLADEWLVRMAVVVVGLWASVGYYAVIILAGLQNIPRQYYEACELDGGNSFESHYMAFAAEYSRVNRARTIGLRDFRSAQPT